MCITMCFDMGFVFRLGFTYILLLVCFLVYFIIFNHRGILDCRHGDGVAVVIVLDIGNGGGGGDPRLV